MLESPIILVMTSEPANTSAAMEIERAEDLRRSDPAGAEALYSSVLSRKAGESNAEGCPDRGSGRR